MVPAALACSAASAFVALGFAGLPLIGRYLLLPAAMLAIFFGFAALGWLDFAPRAPTPALDDRRRRPAGVVRSRSCRQTSSGLSSMRDGDPAAREDRGRPASQLTRIRRPSRCSSAASPIYVPNHRLVPILAWYLDRDPEEIVSAQLERPRRGLFVAPATSVVEEKFVLDPNDPKRLDAEVPRGFTRVTGNESWVLYARGCF